MNFEISFPGFDDLEDKIIVQKEQLQGPPLKKALSSLGKVLRTDTKARVRAGEGYPGLAPSTLEKRAHTGTSLVTKHGEVRKEHAAAIEARVKRLQGYVAWTRKRYLGLGRFMKVPASAQRKIERWQRQLASLNKALIKAQETEYSERKTGKSIYERQHAQNRPLLGRIPDTIHSVVHVEGNGGLLWIRSRWKKQAAVKAHDEGDGHVPQRKIFVLAREHIAKFRASLIEHGIGVIWGGPGEGT